jgi:hypothetical protein
MQDPAWGSRAALSFATEDPRGEVTGSSVRATAHAVEPQTGACCSSTEQLHANVDLKPLLELLRQTHAGTDAMGAGSPASAGTPITFITPSGPAVARLRLTLCRWRNGIRLIWLTSARLSSDSILAPSCVRCSDGLSGSDCDGGRCGGLRGCSSSATSAAARRRRVECTTPAGSSKYTAFRQPGQCFGWQHLAATQGGQTAAWV